MSPRASLCAALVATAGALLVAVNPAAADARVSAPMHVAAPATEPTRAACVVDVADYLNPADRSNDTAAFTTAMAHAVADAPHCRPGGPSGHPQAVVYVPAGTYRIQKLKFVSNVRLEVDAGTTLQEPANRPAYPSGHPVPMIIWDTRRSAGPPLTNVSLVGVGSAMTPLKQQALAGDRGDVMARFGVARDFTMNLDPAATGSTNYDHGVALVNVQHFLIANVFSVQNATDQAAGRTFPWPTSATAVLSLHAAKTSPRHPPYVQPKFGMVENQVNINSPRGFGPNQVNAAFAVHFRNIFTRGGTALRIETDGSMTPQKTMDRGARVQHVSGRNIVGVDCNRAVSLSPHAQPNGIVRVHNVWAYSCDEAVIARQGQGPHGSHHGRFAYASVVGVHAVAGAKAQLDASHRLWVVGRSFRPVFRDRRLGWRARIRVASTYGRFASR